jgi:hypothetical protein
MRLTGGRFYRFLSASHETAKTALDRGKAFGAYCSQLRRKSHMSEVTVDVDTLWLIFATINTRFAIDEPHATDSRAG